MKGGVPLEESNPHSNRSLKPSPCPPRSIRVSPLTHPTLTSPAAATGAAGGTAHARHHPRAVPTNRGRTAGPRTPRGRPEPEDSGWRACWPWPVVRVRDGDHRDGRQADDPVRASPSPSARSTVPGLISFATPSTDDATTPARKERPVGSADPDQGVPRSPAPHESANGRSKPPKPPPHIPREFTRSLQAVGHLQVRPLGELPRPLLAHDRRLGEARSGRLRPESRRDATFKLVKGLSNASCYSFETSTASTSATATSSCAPNAATDPPCSSRTRPSAAGLVVLGRGHAGVGELPGPLPAPPELPARLDPYQQSDLPGGLNFRLVGPLA